MGMSGEAWPRKAVAMAPNPPFCDGEPTTLEKAKALQDRDAEQVP
jgi:hypothetical protein